MKQKTTKIFLLRIMLGLALVLHTNVTSAQAWIPVGNTEFSSTRFPLLALDNNDIPYVFYKDISESNRGVVMRFENGFWDTVGDPAFSHLIYDDNGLSDGWYSTHTLVIDNNNTPYTAYINNSQKVSVRKFEDNSWQFVGETNVSTESVRFISLAIDSNNVPYISYTFYSEGYHIVVKKFENDNWETIGEVSLNAWVHNSFLVLDSDNTPYLAYVTLENVSDSHKITVKKFESNSWQEVGETVIDVESFFFGFALNSQNIPYMAYIEESNNFNNNITVKKLEENNWQTVGEIDTSGNYHWFFSLTFDNNDIPYLSYTSEISNNPLTMVAIIKKFENDIWQSVGVTNQYTVGSSIIMDTNNAPYIAFTIESTGNPLTTSVMKYDPTAGIETTVFNDVVMYPNPANEKVTIANLPENATVKITDFTGKFIYSTKAVGESLTIDTTSFTSGLYLVELMDNNGSLAKKLVIK